VIAIGVLVDNSVLVIEAISRRREEYPEQPINDAVIAATADIGPAVVASTLAFLALFVPFPLVPGLVSLLFRELILVIAGIVLLSLATAVTLTPMLTAVLLGSAPQGRPRAASSASSTVSPKPTAVCWGICSTIAIR
jgi:hydrophobic/amphiphilic exporter-1 (mainly G- bacteria), HAE1 family